MGHPDPLAGLTPPDRGFASDNAAGVHPAVMEALVAANTGHALAYGEDRWTERTAEMFRELFGRDVDTYLVWGGTGANVLALATLLGPAEAVVCTGWSHIHVDETGAPERILGAKLIDLPSPDGKLRPGQIDDIAELIGQVHHVQPGVVSLTQTTELGTLYSADEIAAVADRAHAHGMRVHLDGARIANATAALGGTIDALRSITVDAGVDVISFGGTKAGIMYGEAVVYLDPSLAGAARFVRKQVTQLPSKQRFVAAQFEALLTDDLWLDIAGHANATARRLHRVVDGIDGIEAGPVPDANALFPRLAPAAWTALQGWSFFWDWDTATDQVRWMTAWDTTDEDVERFSAGVRAVVTAAGA
ncbi:MAG: threonine aldolase [Acidimicrobiia bacterium]|nr:threonine aldolase [Acidimicrobiia bacterium]